MAEPVVEPVPASSKGFSDAKKPTEERPKIEFPPLDSVSEPNESELHEFEQQIHRDYDVLQNRMKEVQRLIREKELEKQRTLQEQNRMFSAISLMDADVLKKTKEREPLEMTYESLDRQAKREQDELNQLRQKCEFLDEAALDEAINERQRYLESNSVSAAEERKLVKEISRLRSSRPLIKEYRDKKAVVNSAFENVRKCETSLREKTRELERLIERVARQKQLWDRTKEKESALEKEITHLRQEEVSKITAEMQALATRLNRRREEFRRQRELYQAYKNELARRQRIIEEDRARRQEEQRRKQLEERRAEQERRRKEMQEEYEVVPWCEEMALCDTLISYLERILRQAGLPVPGQADAAPAEGTSSSPGPSPASEKAVPEELIDEDGRPLVVKKDEDEFFFRGKGKKNKREKAAARNKVSESLTHVADIFTGFAKLELQPPLLLSDVAASIEALKAKKGQFKTMPPPVASERPARRERDDRRGARPAPQEKARNAAPAAPFRAADVDWATLPPAKSEAALASAGAGPAPAPAASKPTVWSKFVGRPFHPSAEQPPLPPPKVAAH